MFDNNAFCSAEFPCTRTITLSMQDTRTRSVGGMEIKKAENYLDLERDLNFDVFGIVNILGDNLIDVLDFGLGRGRRGRSCDAVIMSVS